MTIPILIYHTIVILFLLVGKSNTPLLVGIHHLESIIAGYALIGLLGSNIIRFNTPVD